MNAATTANSGAAVSENTALPDPHQDYFEQIQLAPTTVCGRRLQPLSIGRYRRLKRFGVAFVSDKEEEATARDLMIGVLICSLSADEFVQFVSSPKFEKQLQAWGRKSGFFPPKCFSWPLIGKWLYKACGREVDQADATLLLREIQSFQNYIKENSKSPRYLDENGEGKPSAAHWSQSIEVVLRSQVGWTKDEIETEPLNKAIWDFYKHMEQQGCITLMTAEDIYETDRPATEQEIAAENAWFESLKARQP